MIVFDSNIENGFASWVIALEQDALFLFEQEQPSSSRELVRMVAMQIPRHPQPMADVVDRVLLYATELEMYQISRDEVELLLASMVAEEVIQIKRKESHDLIWLK